MYSNIKTFLKKAKKIASSTEKPNKITSEELLKAISITEMTNEQLKVLNNLLQEESIAAQAEADIKNEEEARRLRNLPEFGIAKKNEYGFSKTLDEMYQESLSHKNTIENSSSSSEEIEKFCSENNLEPLISISRHR